MPHPIILVQPLLAELGLELLMVANDFKSPKKAFQNNLIVSIWHIFLMQQCKTVQTLNSFVEEIV